MTDITLCSTPDCAVAPQCRRSPASGTNVSGWQSWQVFKPMGAEGCEDFIEARRERRSAALDDLALIDAAEICGGSAKEGDTI